MNKDVLLKVLDKIDEKNPLFHAAEIMDAYHQLDSDGHDDLEKIKRKYLEGSLESPLLEIFKGHLPFCMDCLHSLKTDRDIHWILSKFPEIGLDHQNPKVRILPSLQEFEELFNKIHLITAKLLKSRQVLEPIFAYRVHSKLPVQEILSSSGIESDDEMVLIYNVFVNVTEIASRIKSMNELIDFIKSSAAIAKSDGLPNDFAYKLEALLNNVAKYR